MSTQDKEHPIDDLGSAEDEEIQIQDLGASDEEIPVHDLDATDDDVSVADLDSLVEEVAVLDLDSTDGESEGDWASLIEEVAAQDGVPPVGEAAPDSDQRDESAGQGASPSSEGEDPVRSAEPKREDADVHDLGSADDVVALHDLDATDHEVDVFDLSSTADRDSVLAEALAHSATLEAQYQQPLPDTKKTGLWKAPLAMVVFVLAGFLVAFPPPWLKGDPLPALDVAKRLEGVHASLYIQAQQVEAFRVETGRLPSSIDEVALTFEGVRFVRSNNRIYQLVLPGPQGTYVVFDSARPSEEVVSAAAGWGMDRP